MVQEQWGYHSPRHFAKFVISLSTSLVSWPRKVRSYARRCAVRQSKTFDVVRSGIKLRCRIGDNLTETDLVFGGKYDNREEISRLMPHLPEGGTFVDVGANCGLFALIAAAKAGPKGRVLAIEPNPVMLDRINFNVAANGFANISVAACAIGDTETTADLHVHAREQGKSSLLAPVNGPCITVPVRTLYALLLGMGIDRIDAMKIDIEGFEDRALMPFLRDAPSTLWPRHLLIETVHATLWQESCIHHLRQAGYNVIWQTADDMILERPPRP